jgi:hypothetical protein
LKDFATHAFQARSAPNQIPPNACGFWV